jgi:hypothetical protein
VSTRDFHIDCDPDARAYTEQTCDRCQRTLIVTPSDDFYCADGSPDHVCEACLTGGLPVRQVIIIDPRRQGRLRG